MVILEPFSKYSLSTYYIPGFVLGAKTIAMNKASKSLPHGDYKILREGRIENNVVECIVVWMVS